MVRYLTESDVPKLLTMPAAIDCVERALVARAQGTVLDIPRERAKCAPAIQHVLQAASPELGLIGYKQYVVTPKGKSFHVHLFDLETAQLRGIVEADHMGRMRTGAASGFATKVLARKDATILGQIGAGRQAGGQFLAVAAVCKLKEARVYSRTPEKLEAFCREMEKLTGVRTIAAKSGEAALRDAHVVNVITRSAEPVLDSKWVSGGAHINAAGSNSFARRELSTATVRRAEVIAVDSRATAMKECGDLLPLVESGHLFWDAIPELGEIACGQRPGRANDDQITLYKSHGMGIQDLYTCAYLLERAEVASVGTMLPIGA
jgi:ornithine cyclodeaminase